MPMKNNEDEVVRVGQSLLYSWRSVPSAARCATDAPEARQVAKTTRK